MSREGYYWKIRDKSLPWTDRVKLVRYAWEHDHIHIPNKQQMLLDWLLYAVGEKKLQIEDRSAIWMCFHDVLHTQKCHVTQQNGQPLKLKSQVVKVLVEELQVLNEDKTGKKTPCSADVIISCCAQIVTSPAFGHSVIGLQDSYLFQMLGSVLQIYSKRLDGGNKRANADLGRLTENLLDKLHHLLTHRPNPKQNFNSLTEKLLEPIIMLLYKTSMESVSQPHREPLKESSTHKIQKNLQMILFNRELQVFYDNYLKIKLPQSSPEEKINRKILPKFIENLFTRVQKSLEDKSKRVEALKFLPVFYKGYVKTYSNSESSAHHFQMLKYLITDTMKINLNDPSKTSPLATSENDLEVLLKVVHELVKIVTEAGVYNIAEDSSGDQIQLKWYKSLASWILNLEQRPGIWYTCLTGLLELNHAILEPKITAVLKKTLIGAQPKESTMAEEEDFLKKLVHLFDQLRQIPKFLNKVIAVMKEGDSRYKLPNKFLESIGECVTQLPTTTLYEVWEMMAKEFSTEADFKSSIAGLFTKVLLSTQLTEHNMAKLSEMSNNIWQENLAPTLMKHFVEKNVESVSACLDLVHSFGEVQILLKYYYPGYTTSCHQFFDFQNETPEMESETGVLHEHMVNCGYVYPEIPEEMWKTLGKLVEQHMAELLFPLVRLQIQKLKAMQLFEKCDEEPVSKAAEAIRSCLCSVNMLPSQGASVKPAKLHIQGARLQQTKLQIYQAVFDHLFLFNNHQWKDTKECQQLLKMFQRGGKSMVNCTEFVESEQYHTAYLSDVWEEILVVKGGTQLGESSAKKRKKQRRSSSSEPSISTADYFIEVLKELQDITPSKQLTDAQRQELLAAVLTQEALPLESLTEENSSMCISNILSALILLNEPVICSQVELKLVQTCYGQFEAVLSSFTDWNDWLEMSDLANLLQFLFSFQMRIESKEKHLEKYLTLVEYLLKPLLKSEDGIVCLEVFVAELMDVCRKDGKDGGTVNQVAIASVAVMLRCLSKNMSRSQHGEKVLSYSTKYFQCLSVICDVVIGKMLVQKQLHVCDASVLDACSVLVIQHCKGTQRDDSIEEGESDSITDQLKSLSHLCMQNLQQPVHRSLKRSCIRFIHTVAVNFNKLETYLPENFIQNSWDAILNLCEQQETKSLFTSQISTNIENKLSEGDAQYNVSHQLNELLKTLNKFGAEKNDLNSTNDNEDKNLANKSDCDKNLKISSPIKSKKSSETLKGDINSNNSTEMDENSSVDEALEVDLHNTLGSLICKADIVHFKEMLEELKKNLENPVLESLTEETDNESADNMSFKTPVSSGRASTVTSSIAKVSGMEDSKESSKREQLGDIAQSLFFNDDDVVNEKGTKTEKEGESSSKEIKTEASSHDQESSLEGKDSHVPNKKKDDHTEISSSSVVKSENIEHKKINTGKDAKSKECEFQNIRIHIDDEKTNITSMEDSKTNLTSVVDKSTNVKKEPIETVENSQSRIIQVKGKANADGLKIAPKEIVRSPIKCPTKVARTYTEEITAVQGEQDILSNFYPCEIHYKRLTFSSSGQAYEYQKALFFSSKSVAGHILFAADAKAAKKIAKTLPRFDEKWDSHKERCMKGVLEAKAKCVPEFREALMKAGRIIVEAVKGDRFWSPGLSKYQVKVTPQHKWPGRNIMGKLLMKLRDEIMENGDFLLDEGTEKVDDLLLVGKTDASCMNKVKSLNSGEMCTKIELKESSPNKSNDSGKYDKQMEKVTAFKGENDILSNFYPCKIYIWNHTFKSVEHAYYYKKALHACDFQLANNVLQASDAAVAKSLMKHLGRIPIWETNKEIVMKEIIDAKLKCVPEFKEELLNSKAIIAEAVPGSNFWSAGLDKAQLKSRPRNLWPGKNRLGELLMNLRDELKKETELASPLGEEDTNIELKKDLKLISDETVDKNIKIEEVSIGKIDTATKETNMSESGQSSVQPEKVNRKRKSNEDSSPMKMKEKSKAAIDISRKPSIEGNMDEEEKHSPSLKRKSCEMMQADNIDGAKTEKLKFREELTCFHGEDDILSNFYPCKINIFGQVFKSAQHAYYYKRAVNANRPDLMKRVIQASTAFDTKKIGKEFAFNESWEKNKGKEMLAVLEQKIKCVPEFRIALLNSGEVIAEANRFDRFWSSGLDKDALKVVPQKKWPGKNVLGRLMMSLRKKLVQECNKTVKEPVEKRLKSEVQINKKMKYDGYLVEKVTAFQGAGDVLSNFYPCKVHIWDKSFASSEHAYQYQKALFSHRKDSAHLIFHSPSAVGAKKISREIATSSLWEANRVKILREIVHAKAECVPEFKQALLTSENLIAEAVARDKFWSCGLSKEAVRRTPQRYWPGKNVMGELLMELKAELLQDCDVIQYIDPLTQRVGRTITSLKIWQKLVTYELTKPQWNILGHVIQQVVLKVQHLLLCQSDCSRYQPVIYITALQLLAGLLSQGPILLSAQSVSTCLLGCSQAPLSAEHLDVLTYTGLYKAAHGVLNQMLVQHSQTVCKCVPSYLAAIKPMLASLIFHGRQKEVSLQPNEETSLMTCAQLMDRLLTLVSTHKEDFSKVALYIVADYVNEVQKVTLLPAVKKALLPGIYKLLDLCDKHAIAQLYTVLSPGAREIFKTLHQEYAKYYKYSGKV